MLHISIIKIYIYSNMKHYFVREKHGKGFKYYNKKGDNISHTSIKKYLNFYIPPAYDDVKINMRKSKVLAIGYDDKDRPQYIYDKKYTKNQSKKKFKKLIDFGENYNRIYRQIEGDIKKPGDSKESQVAMILMIIIDCNFRVGNNKYTKDNNSYGVTTLEKRHIKKKNGLIIIDFIGKKGVKNICEVKNKKIKNKLTKRRKILTNKRDQLFTYRKGSGDYSVSANDVNEYLKKLGNYSTKYFRTWNANIEFIKESKKTKNLNQSIVNVAKKLHHTPSICKKDYINSKLIDFYNNNPKKYSKYFETNIEKQFIEFLKK